MTATIGQTKLIRISVIGGTDRWDCKEEKRRTDNDRFTPNKRPAANGRSICHRIDQMIGQQ